MQENCNRCKFELSLQGFVHVTFLRAIAASAPVLQFTGVTDCGVFSSLVTRTFKNSGNQCDECIRNSWPAIRRLANTSKSNAYNAELFWNSVFCVAAEGQKKLTDIFHLCPNSSIQNPSNATDLISWLSDVYGNLAMVDYPYAANFLNPVPAWPVKVNTEQTGFFSFIIEESYFRSVSGSMRLFNRPKGAR